MYKNKILVGVIFFLNIALGAIDTAVTTPPIPASPYDIILKAITPSLSALRENDGIISSFDRYQTVLSILKEGASDRGIVDSPTLNETTISDLGLLFYDVSKPNFTVLKKINRTKTALGECSLGKILISPSTNIEELKKRQEIIRFLVQDDEARTMLHNIINDFAQQEDQLLALWNKNDLMYSKNMSQSLFNNNLKKKRSAANFEISRRLLDIFEPSSPLIGMGALWFIEKLVMQNNQKSKLGRALLIPGLILSQGITAKTSYSKLKNRRQLVVALKQRFQSLVKLGESLTNLGALARKYQANAIAPLTMIKNFNGTENDDIQKFFDNLTSRSFSLNSGYATAFLGPLLAAVPQFLSIKDRLCSALHALGELDALLSIATLVKEHESFSNHYSYAEYVENAESPIVSLIQFWHPILAAIIAIPNDLELSIQAMLNRIMTGSNAGGKSTNAKAFMLAVLFAQTLTVCAAFKVTLTPFTLINTYLNIVEDAGNAVSQHRAEVRRAKELVSMIQHLPSNQFSITVMDEMFRCTNPSTGAAAAFAIGKELGKLKNSCLILATHYFELTKLANEPDSSFSNMCVDAIKNPDGSFTYPYKIRPGINATVIALDMLASEGFDQRVLDYAYEHLARVESKEAMKEYVDGLRKEISANRPQA